MTGFQTFVGTVQAPAVAGDFCDVNPRVFADAGPGGLVTGLLGITVGRFAWLSYEQADADNAPAVINNFGSGAPDGLVHREQQGLLTQYLQESSMFVPAGFEITLMEQGGIWVKNDGATYAQRGMFAYANLADGKVTFGLTGAPTSALSATASIAASTASMTGSITGNILTVTAVLAGVVRPGATASGTGVSSGTKVVAQQLPLLSGEALGGIGRYSVSIPEQAATSTTISFTYGTMTVTAVASGAVALNQTLSGTGVVAGTRVTQFLTGTGGTGTYAVDNNTVVSSTADIAANGNVETLFRAKSAGAAGELIKIR